MEFRRIKVDNWPKLSWGIAVSWDGATVLRGSHVEHSHDWIFEGTWAGEFSRGNFDRDVSAVIGTGVRFRDDTLCLVSSTSPADRVFYVKTQGGLCASNSLACLLSIAELELDDTYPYAKFLTQLVNDHRYRPRSIPTLNGTSISVLTHDKLVLSGNELCEIPRSETQATFESFEDYRGFLDTTILVIRSNLQAAERQFMATPVTTISRGYDSSASMIIAKSLDIASALTISRVGILAQHDDSGREIAEHFGIPVRSVTSTPWHTYKDHDRVWAGLGQHYDLNMTLFDYPDDLTFLIVGTHGDVVWQKGLNAKFLESHHYLDRKTSGCGLNEWRLHKGVFMAGIPFIGASRIDDLRKIQNSDAMDNWRIGGDYDRPIPRRIIEEAGVPREAFGNKKLATLPGVRVFYPSDQSQLEDLKLFLETKGKKLPRSIGAISVVLDILRTKFSSRWGKLDLRDYEDLFLFGRILELRDCTINYQLNSVSCGAFATALRRQFRTECMCLYRSSPIIFT